MPSNTPAVTIPVLQQMKRDGKKIAAGVCYEAQMARMLERAGIDLLSVGDSLHRAFLGYTNPLDYKVEEMLTFAGAVARTAEHAAVSVDVWVAYPMNPAPDQEWLPIAWLVLGAIGAAVQLGITGGEKGRVVRRK